MNSSEKDIYGFPRLGRGGLGNMLMLWADCYLWCRDNNLRMIAPFWRTLRLGPYLRGERDRRAYHRLFADSGQIAGLSRLLVLLTSKRVRFSELLEPAALPGKTVVVFAAEVCFRELSFFRRLAGRQDELRAGLATMTRPEYLPTLRGGPTIGIHVRLGDYLPSTEASLPDGHYRLELSWYRAALRELRRVAGSSVAAVVYSDGADHELGELLSEENVTRSLGRSAVTDLLELSASGAVIASRSTFSLWGSFLSQAPTVWHPGSRILTAVESELPFGLEPEWAPGCRLPALFTETVRKRLLP